MSQEGEGEDTAGLSLRGFFLAGIRLAHNRLQILATEVAEEKVRLTLAAITGVAGLFFLGLAIVLATILLVTLFWDSHRFEVLAGLSAAFALVGGGLLTLTVRSVTQKVPPFQATLGELKKDQDAWRAAEDNH